MIKKLLFIALIVCPLLVLGQKSWKETQRFDVEEAKQGIAVDAHHFYVINNASIVKYTKNY